MTALARPIDASAPPGPVGRARRWAGVPLTRAGAALALLLLFVAAFAPLIAPRDPTAIDPPSALEPPSVGAPFGRDRFGRDVLSRVVHGTRISLAVGVAGIALAAGVGAALGLAGGYLGGLCDELIGRTMDVFLTFPTLILAITISVVLGVGAQNALLAIAVSAWPSFGRVVRATVLAERGKEYLQAARLLGATHRRIILRHLLPNVVSPLVVQITVGLSHALIVESSLGYLGLGVQPPTPSWGSMLNEGRSYLQQAPWISIFPGAAIMLAVLAFNLLGDGLADSLDPRQGSL